MMSRIKFKFPEICKLAPTLSKTIDEPPNWLRHILDIPSRKGRNPNKWMPTQLEDLVEAIIMERIKMGEEMVFADVEDLVKRSIIDYNGTVESLLDSDGFP